MFSWGLDISLTVFFKASQQKKKLELKAVGFVVGD